MINQGFGRIDFWGPGPINTFGWCTSFFSRNLKIPISKPTRDRGAGDIARLASSPFLSTPKQTWKWLALGFDLFLPALHFRNLFKTFKSFTNL